MHENARNRPFLEISQHCHIPTLLPFLRQARSIVFDSPVRAVTWGGNRTISVGLGNGQVWDISSTVAACLLCDLDSLYLLIFFFKFIRQAVYPKSCHGKCLGLSILSRWISPRKWFL